MKNKSNQRIDNKQISGSYLKGWKIALSTYEEIMKMKKLQKC